ncbi:PTI1-like tyrosine-protein kinase 3 isoform X2 [Impatiens glandulifera]|uniref:PTI1-like tyrosine-protein kinase 3 isoform X2 n=1 Tax=Impatiens glandulifera TaxID=253017 RepID=UPI001FB17DF2|nr:PTI1-like tyrosine-protein kinase 3 isoform X2 [Impatiens glandulifera]
MSEIKEKYYNYCQKQKVVVLQDASSEVSWDAIRWMIDDFSLKEGDELTLVGVLHQVTNPMGFKCKTDRNSMFEVSWKYVEEEIARKKEELNQQILIQIMEQGCCHEMVRVNVEMVAGPCPKVAAAEAANSLNPTWVLLDRKLKKDSKYFLEKLTCSCGISKVTGHNTVQQLRGRRPDDQIIICESSDHEYSSTNCSVCNNKRPNKMMHRRRIDFSYSQLYAATSGFSQKKYLSEGGFGSVYKGRLKDGTKVAVKKLSEDSFQGEKEFKREVKALSNARHKNVVMLLGSCSEGNHRLLVYEYICNGSLDRHLSNDEVMKGVVCWDERIKIAFGAAKGLEYLHSKGIIHRDVRPSNILITHDHQSLLGDFGLAKTHEQLGDSDHNKGGGGVLGTFGYLAPEYAVNGHASTKSDVYSYGVVLLQLITGFTSNIHGGGESLLDWARPLLKSREYPTLIDKRILDSHDVHQLFWMVWVAEKCLEIEPRKRWTMPTVVSALNYIVEGGNANFIQDFFSPAHSDTVDSILNYPGEESDDDIIAAADDNNKTMINNISNESLMMLLDDDENQINNTSTEFVCPAKTKARTTKSDMSKSGPRNKTKGRAQTPSSSNSRAGFFYDDMVV